MEFTKAVNLANQTIREFEALELIRQLSPQVQDEIIVLLKARASDESGGVVLPQTTV